jgi:hypothetical protein
MFTAALFRLDRNFLTDLALPRGNARQKCRGLLSRLVIAPLVAAIHGLSCRTSANKHG